MTEKRKYDFGLGERIVAFLESRNGKPANKRTIMKAVGSCDMQGAGCALTRLVKNKRISRIAYGLYNRRQSDDETPE